MFGLFSFFIAAGITTAACRITWKASAEMSINRRPHLLTDLEQRGLLDDTLVVFCGEFGRTVYCQGKLTHDNYGRDHHPRCFSGWLAGGGIKGGMHYGKTDDFSYNIVEDPVHVRDLHATMLHLLGIDHEKLIFPYQGLDQKLTGVEHARVVREIIA